MPVDVNGVGIPFVTVAPVSTSVAWKTAKPKSVADVAGSRMSCPLPVVGVRGMGWDGVELSTHPEMVKAPLNPSVTSLCPILPVPERGLRHRLCRVP